MAWLDIGTIASIATAGSVIVLLYRIVLNGRRATTRFENELVSEYRDVINELPLEALLGEELSEDTHKRNLPDFYRYIDLSNEQVFLRQENQISKSTWRNWRDGIKSNLSKPAFKEAWCEIKNRSKHDFSELRELEDHDYEIDPYLQNNDEAKRAKHDFWRFLTHLPTRFYKFIAKARSKLR